MNLFVFCINVDIDEVLLLDKNKKLLITKTCLYNFDSLKSTFM